MSNKILYGVNGNFSFLHIKNLSLSKYLTTYNKLNSKIDQQNQQNVLSTQTSLSRQNLKVVNYFKKKLTIPDSVLQNQFFDTVYSGLLSNNDFKLTSLKKNSQTKVFDFNKFSFLYKKKRVSSLFTQKQERKLFTFANNSNPQTATFKNRVKKRLKRGTVTTTELGISKNLANTNNNNLNFSLIEPKTKISTKLNKNMKNLITTIYDLETYNRSNQDTCLIHRPAVFEGQWVQSGDLLADCASSLGGELSLGQNILVGYMPWEGFNYEDAILISQRLVYDDIYTSIHIEKYEIEVRDTTYGPEEITRNIPSEISSSKVDLEKKTKKMHFSEPDKYNVDSTEVESTRHLDNNGIAKLGSWIEEGTILVGKITPLNIKEKLTQSNLQQSPYQKLLYNILDKKEVPFRDSSVRAPKGIRAKVIDIQLTYKRDINPTSKINPKAKQLANSSQITLKNKTSNKNILKAKAVVNPFITKNFLINSKNLNIKSWQFCRWKNWRLKFLSSQIDKLQNYSILPLLTENPSLLKLKESSNKVLLYDQKTNQSSRVNSIKNKDVNKNSKLVIHKSKTFKANSPTKKNGLSIAQKWDGYRSNNIKIKKLNISLKNLTNSIGIVNPNLKIENSKPQNLRLINYLKKVELTNRLAKKSHRIVNPTKLEFTKKTSIASREQFLYDKKIQSVKVFLAEKRRIQVGDKMSGRHGNKGIVSQILPIQDMPFLPDGTPLDIVLNPLGVPSRMNVGQIYECLLGFAGKFLGEHYSCIAFDEMYGSEASRSFVFSKLFEARKKTGLKWIFNPNWPGKIRIFDGRTGESFDQPVTVGQAYMLRLVHMVDDKIHCLTADHEVLTTQGWIPIAEVTTSHFVATLKKNGELIYEKPFETHHYHDVNCQLYFIKNSTIDLCVTLDHRMYVKNGIKHDLSFDGYELLPAKDIIGKHKIYLKNANWKKPDYQFILPSIMSNSLTIPEKVVNMDAWLIFFGLWMAEGWASTSSKELDSNKNDAQEIKLIEVNQNCCIDSTNVAVDCVQLAQNKQQFIHHLEKAIMELGYNYSIVNDKVTIDNKQLWSYLQPLSVSGSQKSLPSWVWELSERQAKLLLEGLLLGHGTTSELNQSSYYTTSIKLADDVMRLVLHAGWSANKSLDIKAGSISFIKGSKNTSSFDVWRIDITTKNNGNHRHHNEQYIQEEGVIPFKGSIYCLTVPNEVFYVRRNGKPVWTGNSRSTGPYSLVTQQPLRGRSKQGGQRLGEMEVWALEGYGAAFTLLEMLTLKSDDMTGRMTLWSNLILNKDIFIGTPESFKVLVSELQALCLDVGLFKYYDSSTNPNSNRKFLKEIDNLMNLP